MVTMPRGCRLETPAGGRARARQLVVSAVLTVLTIAAPRAAGSQPGTVSVREEQGVYRVSASFTTPQPAAIAHAVLTDYEQIPRFMPDVRTSRIVERAEAQTVVEQEAVARVLFFSKRVRLVLEVRDDPTTIRFRDRSGESFLRYEGVWTLRQRDGHAVIDYELTARPAFDVPEFLLTRLLRRDADRMIERLQAEIATRAAGGGRSMP